MLLLGCVSVRRSTADLQVWIENTIIIIIIVLDLGGVEPPTFQPITPMHPTCALSSNMS